VIYKAMAVLGSEIKGLIHCSGGAQTKCLKFGRNVHFVKDNLFPTPPLFKAIQQASGTDWQEMYKVFNMGHRMEVYLPPARVDEMIDIARSFGIDAQQIGFTQSTQGSEAGNQLSLTDHAGTRHEYE
jgi:phosphoribosylformylglycinamidine cyclo-ligase